MFEFVNVFFISTYCVTCSDDRFHSALVTGLFFFFDFLKIINCINYVFFEQQFFFFCDGWIDWFLFDF